MATVTVNQPPPQPPKTYNLHLSETEVTYLRTLLSVTATQGPHHAYAETHRELTVKMDIAGVKHDAACCRNLLANRWRARNRHQRSGSHNNDY